MLNDGRAVPGCGVVAELADAQLHEVTAALLAIDSEVEQGQVADPALTLKVEANGSDLLGLEGRLGTDKGSLVPWHHGADGWRHRFRIRRQAA